jgi:hypothetical protein
MGKKLVSDARSAESPLKEIAAIPKAMSSLIRACKPIVARETMRRLHFGQRHGNNDG